MNYGELINTAETFVIKYIHKHDDSRLLYHNLGLTKNIVAVANEIAEHYSLEEKERFVVATAAWFLNIGYYKDVLHPAMAGAEIAEGFLNKARIGNDTIESVRNCMLLSVPANSADTLPGDIIKDAKSFYLGDENFPAYNKLKRKESERINSISIDKDDWKRCTVQMMANHQYYTEFAQSKFNNIKAHNFEKLKKKISMESSITDASSSIAVNGTIVAERKEKGSDSKVNSADRTVETMFRTTSANSQRLSSQADSKAHIMISVNTIIVSLLLGIVVRKIDDYRNLIAPVIIFLLVNLISIIFAILATRPNIRKGKFSDREYRENKVNLLFFDNFISLAFDEYAEMMLQIMSSKQELYIAMLRNLYEQGLVLSKKYRMLKVSYNVFMVGIVLSVITFFIASRYF